MIYRPKTGENEESQVAKTGRVIIVDDHTAFRQALAMVLRKHTGFDVCAEAASPAEARSILQKLNCRLDLAVVDLDLPDGEKLTRELNECASGTSVLGLTAGRARVVGARGTVLTTEASVDEILAAVQRLVR